MFFRRRKLTDEEFVEHTRRQMTAGRKIAYWMIGLSIAGLLVWLYVISCLVKSFRTISPNSSAYDMGFAFGAFTGFLAVNTLLLIGYHLFQAILMAVPQGTFRIHRLLVKYYDEARSRG